MATKIRLQRHGKKGYAFYHVVVADSRSKRDGKFIEKLGVYNPNTNPATIDINFDRTLDWVQVGAEMTDTARAILSYKGVLYKNHLLKGVTKGALSEADVEKKFEAWLKDKESKIASKADNLKSDAQKAEEARLKAEKEKSEARAKEIAAKNAPEEPVAEEAPAEEVAAETATEEPKAEETAPTEEAKAEEAPAEEPKKEEAPAEEPKADAEGEKEEKEKSAE
jgi:small subunit ribosomal protein S16